MLFSVMRFSVMLTEEASLLQALVSYIEMLRTSA